MFVILCNKPDGDWCWPGEIYVIFSPASKLSAEAALWCQLASGRLQSAPDSLLTG